MLHVRMHVHWWLIGTFYISPHGSLGSVSLETPLNDYVYSYKTLIFRWFMILKDITYLGFLCLASLKRRAHWNGTLRYTQKNVSVSSDGEIIRVFRWWNWT